VFVEVLDIVAGSYRTYEEWKLEVVKMGLVVIIVLTVPMRNGNLFQSDSSQPYNLSSYRTYEEWKLNSIDKPNIPPNSSYRTYEEWKLSFFYKSFKMFFFRSYRTYEEWKQFLNKIFAGDQDCSYRTYEEWKLFTRLSTAKVTFSSYRTYEEWKRSSVGSPYSLTDSSYRTYEEWKLLSNHFKTVQ